MFEEISFRVRMKDPGYDDVVKIETQVSFLLIPEQKDEEGRVLERAAKYVADIVLYRNDGNITVIDVKSAPTRKHPVYVLKRKLMRHVHGVSIVEI